VLGPSREVASREAAVSREAAPREAAASREAVPRLGSLTAQKKFTVIRVSRRRGYSPYTRYIIGIG
jgi:hypothetical protein